MFAGFYQSASGHGLIQAGHLFGGGNAGARMGDREISSAVALIGVSFPEYRAKYGASIEQGRSSLRTAARALMQLWGDLDLEERNAREKKALTRQTA